MSRVTRPALRGTLLGSVLRFLNPVVRRVLLSRFHWPLSRWLALLSWRPPDRLRRRTTPVSYIRESATAYITTGDRWSADLERGSGLSVRMGGRWHDARADVVNDPEQSAAVLSRLFHEHPWFRVLSGIPPSSSGGADRAAVKRALAAGRVLVRVALGPAREEPARSRPIIRSRSGVAQW